jgi:AcrR family transcriptional regulator
VSAFSSPPIGVPPSATRFGAAAPPRHGGPGAARLDAAAQRLDAGAQRPGAPDRTTAAPAATPARQPASIPARDAGASASGPANTRDAILDAAGVLLGRFGYHKTTMDDLATEAGIARRTLYLHFRCKDDIFLARIDRVVERLFAEEKRIANGPGDAKERLARLLAHRVAYRLDVMKDYTKSLDEIFAALRAPYLERRSAWFAVEATILARVLEQGRSEGHFAFEDANDMAQAMIAATNALIP